MNKTLGLQATTAEGGSSKVAKDVDVAVIAPQSSKPSRV